MTNTRVLLFKTIKAATLRYPEIVSQLDKEARYIAVSAVPYKSQEYFLSNITRLVTSLYDGNIGGDFTDILSSLIQGQINDAYQQAWKDDGGEPPIPEYLEDAANEAVLSQWEFVQGFYESIVDAQVDETPIEPLLSRAQLWANQWTSNYGNAVRLIALENNDNLVWKYGDTDHCDTCRQLDGIVAKASTWDELGVQPQNGPNPALICQGFRCQCTLTPTKRRQTPKAYDLILNATTR